MANDRILIKIGGKAAQGPGLRALVAEMAALRPKHDFVLVHGGGAEVTRISKIFGIEAIFDKGVRVTSPAEMEIVDMVLAGKMNKALVRLFQSSGIPAVGISGSDGGLFTGESAGPAGSAAATRTGRISAVDPRLLAVLLGAGYLPVIATTSMDKAGGGLNINADDAAMAIAAAFKPSMLVFLSDIPGILKNGTVLPVLDAAGAAAEIAAGVVSGGMIPKLNASLAAVRAGAGAVVIGEFSSHGDLAALMAGTRGTRIHGGTV
jgi:acetylglutamate kinase